MKYSWGIFFVFVFCRTSSLIAQDTSTISINGYIDAYYSYDNNEPITGNQPYLVSSARHNDFSINLAMLDFDYISSRVRGRFATGFGSYMNANYAAEVGSFKNIVEATAGVKLSEKKEIWLDAGIMGAPFSYENAISKDQLLYSRSLAAEGSPYYVSGVKLTAPLAQNVTGAVYLVNGWQQITDINNQKSIIAHVKVHPSDLEVNLSAYYGSEQNISSVNDRERLLIDFNINYKNKNAPLSLSMGTYYGVQQVFRNNAPRQNFEWWQSNIAAKYFINKKISIAGRAEFFNDVNSVIYNPVTATSSFQVGSFTLGANYAITPNALFRVEARRFSAASNTYFDADINRVNSANLIWASLAINFGHSFQLIKK